MQNTVFGKSEFTKSLVSFNDSMSLDSFGNLRTSSPIYVFDNQFEYTLSPLIYEQITAGTGAAIAHDATNRIVLNTFASTPTGGKSYLQTKKTLRYQPGRSQKILLTCNFKSHTTDCYKWVGYSNITNGIEFGSDGANGFCVKIKSASGNGNQVVYQSDWNMDRMDGTGISGKTLDVTKSQIILIDFQALYVGRVRISLVIDGIVYPIHIFNHSNSITTTYIQTANLPISAGMTVIGDISARTVSTTMNFICASVSSESGEINLPGIPFSCIGTGTAGNGTAAHILTIRPKKLFNSITNRVGINNLSLELLVTGSNPVRYDICIGQALAATPTYADVNTTYSSYEFCSGTGGTLSSTPAAIVYSGFVSSSATAKGQIKMNLSSKIETYLDSAGENINLGNICILGTGISGTSAMQAILNFEEIR